MLRTMWLSAFCAVLAFAGFGCEQAPQAPDAPIAVTASVHGDGQAGILVVSVTAQTEAPHAQVELNAPAGVRVVGGSKAEAEVLPGQTKQFRFPVKADKPGAYVIGIKVMAGEDSYRFGKSITVAWVAQRD